MTNDEQKIKLLSLHHKRVQGLMQRVNEQSLLTAHREQPRRKAVGVDGIRKNDYDQQVAINIQKLVADMKKFSYRPQPVRRVYIPKGNNKMRPLGIPSYEDRLVQAVMAKQLNAMYDARFLSCSFGFRRGMGAHDAIRYINCSVMFGKVNYVLDADIHGFFDNVNQEWLMKFLEHDIADKVFLRYIKRFLKAGIMEGTEIKSSDKGTPQGGLISPVLANVYLHYVLDLWIERIVRKRMKGQLYYIRYADDILLLFEYEEDARRVLDTLRKRLGKFGLELSEDKTKILPFGRWKGTKESFDFLGFTFYNTKGRNGKYRIGIRTSLKKLKVKRQNLKSWLRKMMIRPVSETMMLLQVALRGHCGYYGINGNMKYVCDFYDYVKVRTYKMLKRRSQRSRMTSEKFDAIWNFHIKRPRVMVDIWSRRLFEEPDAGKPHVRFCEGQVL